MKKEIRDKTIHILVCKAKAKAEKRGEENSYWIEEEFFNEYINSIRRTKTEKELNELTRDIFSNSEL